MVEIATNLTNDSTNVNIYSLEELLKFVKFAGGASEVYIFIKGFEEWQTVSEFSQSNKLEVLF